MKTLFVEGDLKNAYSEAYKVINKSDKDIFMAVDSLVFLPFVKWKD